MTTFVPVDPTQAAGRARVLLDAVQAKLKMTPNMTRHMAQSPAVLEGYLGFAGALAGGALAAPLREQIALATAQENGCDYCLSAHSLMGKGAGLTAADIAGARAGTALDSKAQAALRFVRALIAAQGNPAGEEVTMLRTAGFGDGEIGEIVANVALNIFTNYFNNVVRPVVDFPVVTANALARAA